MVHVYHVNLSLNANGRMSLMWRTARIGRRKRRTGNEEKAEEALSCKRESNSMAWAHGQVPEE